MSRYNPPEITFSSLKDLGIRRGELDEVAISQAIIDGLDRKTLTTIKNAFFNSLLVTNTGQIHIELNKLSHLLRTGNSGAEMYFVNKGMGQGVSPSRTREIEEKRYISSYDFEAILSARITQSRIRRGTKYQYLKYVRKLLDYLYNHDEFLSLSGLFMEQIDKIRPQLKKQRLGHFMITHCEFSNQPITNNADVEFAHIESVVTNPERATDMRNGVIIMKPIHRDMTNKRIHDFEDMYDYCIDNGYFTDWADDFI